jgi:LPS-assembly protein
MNQTDRRQQLAFLLCCGMTSALVGGYAGDVAAQALTPFRVDPVLLGMPPASPEPPPVAAPRLSDSAPKDSAEVLPVKPDVVEADMPPVSLKPPPAAAPRLSDSAPEDSAEVRRVEPDVIEIAPATPREPVDRMEGARVPSVQPEAILSVPEPDDDVAAPLARADETLAAPVVSSSVDAPGQVKAVPPAAPAPQVAALEVFRVYPTPFDPPPARLAERPQPAASPSLAGALPDAPLAKAGETEIGPSRDGGKVPHQESPLVLRAATETEPLTEDDPESRPVFLSALRMAGEIDREFVAEGEAELRKADSIVNAELMMYWPLEDEVEAEGRVRLQQGEDVMTGPKMRLRMEDRIGYFEQPFYQIKHQSLLGRKRDGDQEASDQQVEALAKSSTWNSGFSTPQAMNLSFGQTRFDDKLELSTTTATTASRGEAKRIDFEGENHYRLLNNTFTTCPIDNDAWYVKTSELKLDYDREVAEGRDATVYFQGVPFLYSPWFSFSLNDERKSGFLPPSIGTNSDNGFEYQQPYYWNIAPNMDAMISPRAMSKRGIQFGSEFRYLDTALGGVYQGKAKVEYLSGDRLRDGSNRYAFSLQHSQNTSQGFSGQINYTKASDDNYYTDLSSDISGSSQTQLLQQGILSYGSTWWSASVDFQQYQTLQSDVNNPVLEQYRMLPQLTFDGRSLDFHGVDVNLLGQYTRFSIRRREQFDGAFLNSKYTSPDGKRIFPDGNRTVLYPQISLPYIRPGWYVTPKIGVNYRRYSLNGQPAGVPDSISVALPVFSVDSGMTFERSSHWFGRDYTQTLEPRLYYLNVPYKDQSDIPLFDTALADFNFAQIFSENQFSGWDRVSNANQLTAALTSRLVEPESGSEIMRAMIGQRFYFTRSRVELVGNGDAGEGEKWNRSDFLAGFGGQILPKVFVDTAWQFDLDDRRSKRYAVEMRYRPEPGKVLNVAYRRNRDTTSPVNQVDVSGQWPLFGRWHGVGRLNYSFKDDEAALSTKRQGGRVIESIAGLEYNGGCWILRGFVRRQALTSENASTAFFVQLELSGLGRIGSNPLSLLKRNVQGYGLVGSDDSVSVFDE